MPRREDEGLSFAITSSFVEQNKKTLLKIPLHPLSNDIVGINGNVELRYMARVTAWMERLQEEERPNANNGGKISDDQQTYPYNDWLALETEAEAAALAHFARVLPTSHKVVAVYELINPDLRTKFKEQQEKDKGAFSQILMYHGADVPTLLVIAQEGFKTEACNYPSPTSRSVYVSNSSQYSLGYSTKAAHSQSKAALTNVANYRQQLEQRGRLQPLGQMSWVLPKGKAPELAPLPFLTASSTGMYVCDVLVPVGMEQQYVADTMPGRPSAAIYFTPVAERVCPKFFVHLQHNSYT